MWSLPDIARLNANAAVNAKTLEREASRNRKPACEIYGCKKRAIESSLWFDIFSDHPKGVIHTCAEHSWADDPDLFACDHCKRVLVDHYTWERYQIEINGATLCLKCAAEEYFADPTHWIDPGAVKTVVFERFNSALNGSNKVLFNPATGILNAACCRHILGVKQPLPEGIEYFDNAEFDSENLHQISGDSLLEIIQRLDDQPFCPVLDGAYQFAHSLGIYVRADAEAVKEAA